MTVFHFGKIRKMGLMRSLPLVHLLLLLLVSTAQVSSIDIGSASSSSTNTTGSEDHVVAVVVKGANNRRLLPFLDCGELCKERCSLHSRPNLCTRACGTCCFRCKCVPPGTSGNRELCGKCYTDMTTHGNRTKCP
ncbi:gibberellin-regulated protein 9-like [Punica granatum]|uniref:Gibberellin-regulated protein 9-like n=2 Tax=Punica granatum TaxID=22663 RepID=A0A6P8CPT8_PUNGR|nr:gibberellin-regulated protein 9-like [Punica granatum]